MTKFIKNFAQGLGNIFLTIPAARDYQQIPRSGFRQDANTLRGDAACVVRSLANNVHKARKRANGKAKSGNY